MYENIGDKIKGLAKACGWILLLGGVVAFFIAGAGYGFDEFLPWLLLLGGLLGFVSSWPLYGFGELIERTQSINKIPAQPQKDTESVREKAILDNGGWKCVCRRVNFQYVSSCECGKSRREGDISKPQ